MLCAVKSCIPGEFLQIQLVFFVLIVQHWEFNICRHFCAACTTTNLGENTQKLLVHQKESHVKAHYLDLWLQAGDQMYLRSD